MSSASSYPRCALELRASRRLFLCSILLTAIAIAAPWLAGVPALPASLLGGIALPASARLLRWSRGELRKIVWQSDGRWVLIDTGESAHEEARLLPGIWVGAAFLSLHWRCDACGKSFRATLLDDNCDADEFRRLRVRVRLTPDDRLFANQSDQRTGDSPLARLAGTSTVSRGGCRSSRSG